MFRVLYNTDCLCYISLWQNTTVKWGNKAEKLIFFFRSSIENLMRTTVYVTVGMGLHFYNHLYLLWSKLLSISIVNRAPVSRYTISISGFTKHKNNVTPMINVDPLSVNNNNNKHFYFWEYSLDYMNLSAVRPSTSNLR